MTTCDALLRASLLAPALVLTAAPAIAQSAEDQATARALFNEARQLMKAGSYDRACPKLAAAAKLYGGSGVLLNLGDCYEHVGRTASAWTEFAESASAAEREGRADDLAEARHRQAAIEPKLSRLTIRVPHELPGLVVQRDGTELDRGAWGAAVPVDPGAHTISATAPGHASWSGSASLTEAGKTVTVDVPDLGVAAPAAAPAAVPAEAPSAEPPAAQPYWTGRREASAALTGAGVAGLVAGGILVGVAKTKDSSAQGEATNRASDSANAVSLGNVATVVTSVGAAVAVGGLLLWLTAPDAPVQVGASGAGVLVTGRF